MAFALPHKVVLTEKESYQDKALFYRFTTSPPPLFYEIVA